MHIPNILLILTTCDVSKFDKSRDFNIPHPLNIIPISFTWEVSKFDKFKNSKDLQL